MKERSLDCFGLEELHLIVHGQLPSSRSDEIEQHLSNCEECRSALERAAGDEPWWSELETALSDKDIDEQATSHASDDYRHLIQMLGPTDDPKMLGRIGSYEIVGILGQGGMGAVFKAFDAGLNRYVAIKVLLAHLASTGAARERFRREGQAAAAVVDDHVLPIYAVDQWQGVPYLVMQYVRGPSLQKRLNEQGPLELLEVLRIGLHSARGLAAAHAQGLVHRDIKPSNILLDGSVDRAILTDFGLARAVDDASMTGSGMLAGTPMYMSPEQAQGKSIDARSDLFSLGSTLYALCTGHAPFRADSSYAILRRITDDRPRPIRESNPKMPKWLERIIERLLAKDPADRYQSAQELATLLEHCLAHTRDPIANRLPRIASRFAWLKNWRTAMNGKPLLSVFALSLLVAAILLPWPIMAFGREEFALIFAGASIVLSLYFAWLARAEYLSQVVLKTVGGLVGLIVLIVVVSFPLFMWRSNVDRVEAMRQVAARNEEEQRLRSQIEYGERMLLDDRAELKKSLDQGAQRLEEQAQAEVVKQTAPPSGVSETVKPANLKGTLQKLQGRWKVTLWNQNNETAQADEPVEMRFLFEGDRLFQTARSPFAGEQSEAKIPWGRIEINQESQPAQVAIVNENQGTEKRIGLIEVIGDKLRMAFRTTETGISSSEFPKDILAGDNVIYIECTKAN